MVKIPLRYLVEDRSRHGQVRLYVRRPGQPKIRLWVTPGHPEFLAAYQAALQGRQLPKPEAAAPGAPSRSIPGTFRALCEAYMASSSFKAIAPIGQRTQRGILEHCCQQEVKEGSGFFMADCPLAVFSAKHVIALRDAKLATPAAANNRVKAIRRVFTWAQEEDQANIVENPARRVKLLKRQVKGFHSWTLEEVAKFERRHPIGTTARLALDLLLYTAQRRSDVVRLGRQHVAGDWLVLTQGKTQTKVEIPIIAPLAVSIARAPQDQMQFLINGLGKPFTANGFGNKFREWCNEAGLPHCTAHGLRKATSARLAELGCSEEEIAAITGHLTAQEIKRYTRAARRRIMAGSAMQKLAASLNGEQKCPTPE